MNRTNDQSTVVKFTGDQYKGIREVVVDMPYAAALQIHVNRNNVDRLMQHMLNGEDIAEVVCAPLDSRPLSLKNTDNKTIAGVNAWSASVVMQNGIDPRQRLLVQFGICCRQVIGRLFCRLGTNQDG